MRTTVTWCLFPLLALVVLGCGDHASLQKALDEKATAERRAEEQRMAAEKAKAERRELEAQLRAARGTAEKAKKELPKASPSPALMGEGDSIDAKVMMEIPKFPDSSRITSFPKRADSARLICLPKLGTWLVKGKDIAGTTWKAPLVFTKNIDELTNSGYFDWKTDGASSGREHFRGTFNPKTRIIRLTGERIERPRGRIACGLYEAAVSSDGLRLTNGRWREAPGVRGIPIPGTWTAEWKAEEGATAELKAEAPYAKAASLSDELLHAPPGKQDKVLMKLRDSKGTVYTEALAKAIPRLPGDAKKKARDAMAVRLMRMTAETLSDKLQDEDVEIRRAATLACAMKEEKIHIPKLIELLKDLEPSVARAAHVALKSLTDKDFGPPADNTAADRDRAVAAWKAWWQKNKKD